MLLYNIYMLYIVEGHTCAVSVLLEHFTNTFTNTVYEHPHANTFTNTVTMARCCRDAQGGEAIATVFVKVFVNKY